MHRGATVLRTPFVRQCGLPAVVLVCLSVPTGCARYAWNQAPFLGTIESFESFIEQHPKSEQVARARAQVSKLTTDYPRWREETVTEVPSGAEHAQLSTDGKHYAWVQKDEGGQPQV
jgi:hypothetical protein